MRVRERGDELNKVINKCKKSKRTEKMTKRAKRNGSRKACVCM